MWKLILYAFLAALIGAGVILLLLQTRVGKDLTANFIQNWFNDRYEGELTIGALDGQLPFWADAHDVLITHQGTGGETDTVVYAESVEMRPEWGDVFTRRFSLHDIRVHNARFNFDFSDSYDLKAFQLKQPRDADSEASFLDRTFYLPHVSISESSARLTNLYAGNSTFDVPAEIVISDINTTAFVEAYEGTLFFDFDEFNSTLSGLPTENLRMAGQLYTDRSTLELNGFRIETGSTATSFNARIDNFTSIEDLRPDNEELAYKLNLRQGDIALYEWRSVLPGLDRYPYMVSATGELSGSPHQIDAFNVHLKGHELETRFDGRFQDVFDKSARQVLVEFRDTRIGREELALSGFDAYTDKFEDWDQISASGRLQSDADSVNLDSELKIADGRVSVQLTAVLQDSTLTGDLEFKDVNSRQLPSLAIAETRLNGNGKFTSQGWHPEDLSGDFEVNLENSGFDHINIREGVFAGRVSDQTIHTQYDWQFNSGRVEGDATYRFADEHRAFTSEGQSRELDMAQFSSYWNGFPSSALNFNYKIDIEGSAIEELFGYAQIDIEESLINGDTLRAHQMYIDLDEPVADKRSLRFTSSFFDLIVEGELNPVALYNKAGYWGGYLYDQLIREVALDEPDSEFYNYFSERIGDDELVLEATLDVKDLNLLRHYYDEFPPFQTRTEVDFNLNISKDYFLLSGSFQDEQFSWERIGGNNISGFISAQFQSDGTIREYGVIDFNLNTDQFSFDQYEGGSLSLDAFLEDGFMETRVSMDDIGDNVHVKGEAATELRIGEVHNQILELEFGSPGYLWKLDTPSELTYYKNGRLDLSPFTMINDGQLFYAEGVFSREEDDQVSYRLENINLDRISDIIDGRIPFAGTVNGSFITRTLNDSPFFEGEIRADDFAIDGRILGEVKLSSSYNIEQRRFDTVLDIYTNPELYADYLEENDGVGQNLSLKGYFVEPDWDNPEEEFYHFDGEFEQIDLWVLPYIVNNIFEDVEGEGRGAGYLSGSLEDIDFHADFEVLSSDAEPVFFETRYNITGDVELNRHDGVTLIDMDVKDGRGGTGKLYGNISFNDFARERELDFTLELNRLHFMNNSFDPEIPFYGSMYGSGRVRASGTNVSPVILTPQTIRVTSDSRLGVPLIGGTQVEDQRRFIRFVREFGDVDFSIDEMVQAGVVGEIDRTFTETFTLDLDFEAPQNLNVELVFDPVTGETLTSTGSGRMRITLEDEEYGMIGRYDVEDGDYRFVAGDIFTRRFNLREGGSIIWDGDPANARLDIEASYRSRPDINALLETGDADFRAQRIPVDLILEITGTIQEVENDFFFEFPNAIDATQNAAVLSVLNSEDQKLLQATALLLTGGFIPVGQDGFAQAQQFSTTVQARAGEVGLSQLVSAQINEMLNTNLANLDIDLNLIGFDQADLGIALRLFDDRLELRRDGQVTGEQEYILGDLGATYRISPTFSVEVFHRKDPTLIGVIGPQAQQESVNGVGLEAQVQFNTWQELQQRITGAFRRLFGLRDEEEEEPEGIAEEP